MFNRALKKLHPDDLELGLKAGKTYSRWNATECLLEVFEGTNTYIPWKLGKYFIMVCHLSTNHWVVVRVCVREWRVEVYDSLLHRLDKGTNGDHRTIQLLCICHLFPRLLALSGYWGQQVTLSKRTDFMELVFMPREEQFIQIDGVSCGIYACVYMDRILASIPPRLRHVEEEKFVKKARKRLARRIFSLSLYRVEGPVDLSRVDIDL